MTTTPKHVQAWIDIWTAAREDGATKDEANARADRETGECGYCWRLANLTKEQREDPANAIAGTIRMCSKHQRVHEQLVEAMSGVEVVEQQCGKKLRDNGPSPDFCGESCQAAWRAKQAMPLPPKVEDRAALLGGRGYSADLVIVDEVTTLTGERWQRGWLSQWFRRHR